MTAFDRDRVLALMDQGFRQMVPHNAELGLRMIDCAPGMAVLVLPWNERLIGNPEKRVLHGGAITTLVDACCGASVFLRLGNPTPIATLDLRIDYLKPATPDRDVVARAECYHKTKNVAFVRAVACHDDRSDPIASAAATFMLSTKGKSVGHRT
ncbi:MAG: PaaI family thioesterase [Myxococcales bacterium]|nr:PaaI family thioesterase [Myxococcales bacterium]